MKETENAQRSTPNPQLPTEKSVRELFEKFVLPTYGRFDLVLERGEGSYLWDIEGRRYLDFGGGIAVCSLGHANPEITEALTGQCQKLLHVSNLYYNKWQGELAERLVELIGPGRCFFCNSGAEANEGLYKLARKFGHDTARFEVISTVDSFHGRTLAGIAATGQEKVKKGFEPMVAGFKQVPFNDLAAMRAAISSQTSAILVEAVQGESGVSLATRDYLLGLRQLCDERNLLLLLDEVQAGHFRTGKFHGWQTIAGDTDFRPDGISMAKSLGGGFPIGAFWVREEYAGVLAPGTHATTFGGNPLGCAVALKILEVMKRDDLGGNAVKIGGFLVEQLRALQNEFPDLIREVRGLGLMIGLEFAAEAPAFRGSEKSPAMQMVTRLQNNGLLTVPAANAVVRILPALNLKRSEAEEGVGLIKATLEHLKG